MMERLSGLIDRILAGDRDAYEHIVNHYQEMLMAYTAFRVSDRSMVEEIVQQTFIKAFYQLANFRKGKDFGVWLRAIAHYVILGELKALERRQKNLRTYRDRLNHAVISGILEMSPEGPGSDVLARLAYCVAKLTEASRRLIDMKYTDGMSAKKMAEMLQRSRAWVATTLFRIRQEIRACIDRAEREETA
jgi:RNA polymerase sigma-70 factor (ECF subfamily)